MYYECHTESWVPVPKEIPLKDVTVSRDIFDASGNLLRVPPVTSRVYYDGTGNKKLRKFIRWGKKNRVFASAGRLCGNFLQTDCGISSPRRAD